MKNILILIGTRPEAIKLAPLTIRLKQSSTLKPILCSTGQHKEMLDNTLADFGLTPDLNLGTMQKNQTLISLSAKLFEGLDNLLNKTNPAAIIVQGDTTTALAGAISGFYSRIPVGHVEAGLRSSDLKSPWPEEFNRRSITLATTWHFAPTTIARDNLVKEGIAPERIHLVGNTIVDALNYIRQNLLAKPASINSSIEKILKENIPFVLITGHRRENLGAGLESICEALSRLAIAHPDYRFVWPVHLNPSVHDVVWKKLRHFKNIILLSPCGYQEFLQLLNNCSFVLSDSGGIQEEAPSFRKKVLVMRDVTERPEGVMAGYCLLVGTNTDKIVMEAEKCFSNHQVPNSPNPYGDGLACERIHNILEKALLQ